jgi:hypothetical protein
LKDSFLPSNTVTPNRSHPLSHVSIESLSNVYNQNMRLKFGSAPAQLMNEGRLAAKSLDKRVSNIRKQFDNAHNVSTQAQRNYTPSQSRDNDRKINNESDQNNSKQATKGNNSSTSWTRSNQQTRLNSVDNSLRNNKQKEPNPPPPSQLLKKQNDYGSSSDDDDDVDDVEDDDDDDDDDELFNSRKSQNNNDMIDSPRSSSNSADGSIRIY